MNYKILFYAGCIMTAVTLISTIVAFFKCNVIEIVCDLLGIKLQKKVKIKRKAKNKKSKTVASTVKVKKKSEVKIRSKAEIEDSQNTKSYTGPRKRSERTGILSSLTGSLASKSDPKEEAKDTSMIPEDEFIEDTGIMEVNETDIMEDEETSMMEANETDVIDDETSMITEDTGIMGEENTCMIDEKSGIEEKDLDAEEDETSLLGDDDDQTSLLDDEDETSLLGIEENDEDETCLIETEVSKLEDGFAERFTKELEVIVVNSDTII